MTQHATNQVIFNLNHYGLIQVRGNDAKKLLQGQLTCHLDEVSETSARLAAHCNPQGRILSFFRVLMAYNSYFLLTDKIMIEQTINHLKKYAVFYKTTISDESNHFEIHGLQTDQPNLLTQLPANDDISMINLHEPSSRYVIISKKNMSPSFLMKLTNDFPIKDNLYWKHIDINSLLPTIYPETSGKFLPHELGLHHHNAISLSKGCYTGQEIIARMHYRGKLKTKLYRAGIRINSTPKPGSDIYHQNNNEANPCGILVDICQEGYNNYVALILTTDDDAINDHLFLREDPNTFFTILN